MSGWWSNHGANAPLPEQAWQIVEWREGSNEGRFARVRVHVAHRDNLLSELRPEA